MDFSEEWVQTMNDSRNTKQAGLTVLYLNGFKGTPEFSKNQMTDWKIVSADKESLELKLTFQDPIWVSQNVLPCFVTLNFRDGLSFKSAGLG